MDIEDRVIKEIAEYLETNANEITRYSTRSELWIDSLDEIEILMAIEEAFLIEIPDDAFVSADTVGDFVKTVTKAVVEQERSE